MERIKNLWHQFLAAIDQVEEESNEHRAQNRGKFDVKFALTIGLACVLVATLEYFGGSSDYILWEKPVSWFVDDTKTLFRDIFRTGPRSELFRLMYWSGCTFMAYLVIPALFVVTVLKGRLQDYGLSFKGIWGHSWIYFGLYLVVLPFVVAVAFSDSFQRTYPFYDNAHLSVADLLMWEMIYALQFLSLEFFYRGFLISALKPRFGYYAIFVSVIPYCMIHFGKPYPETIGAILAGLALGTLAMFTRSIFLGVAIHISVAVTMDVLSLGLQGKLSQTIERLF